MNQKMLIYAFSSIAVGIISFFVEPVRETLHTVIDIFVKGYSPVRIYVVSGGIALLFLIASFPLPNIKIKRIKVIVVASAIAVFSFGLFTQVWFDHVYSIPAHMLSLSVNDGKITGSAFSHIHIGKSVTNVLVGSIISQHQSIDSGSGISPFIPVPFKIIFGLLGVIFFAALVFWFLESIVDVKEYRAQYVISFAFVAAPLLIRMIDGGLFSAGTLLFLGVCIAVVITRSRRTFLTILLSAFVLQMGWYLFFPQIILPTIPDIAPYFIITPTVLAFYVAIFGNTFSINKKLVAVCGGLIFLGVALLYREGFLETPYSHVYVSNAFVASYELKNDKAYSLRGSIGALHIYEYSGATTSVSNLAAKENSPDEYVPVFAPGKNCSKESTGRATTFRLLSKEFVSDVDVPSLGVKIAFKEIPTPVFGMYAYRGVLLEPECLPQPLSVLAETIGLAGGKRFIVSERQ